MSFIEILNMAKEAGCEGPMLFYFSSTEPFFSDKVLPLQEDLDVSIMFTYSNIANTIGVYVEHTQKTALKNYWVVSGKDRRVTESEEEEDQERIRGSVQQKKQTNPKSKRAVISRKKKVAVRKRREEAAVEVTIPNKSSNIGSSIGSTSDSIIGEEIVGTKKLGVTVAEVTFVDDVEQEQLNQDEMNVDVPVDMDSESLNLHGGNISESDCDISQGEDSEHSDFYEDSDGNYELNEDDVGYDMNVDQDAEWGGLSGRSHSSNGLSTRSKKTMMVVHVPETQSIHAGNKVFNPATDMEKVVFKHNLCFSSRQDVINAIKKHALEHTKDIRFPIRNDHKIQAVCKHDDCEWYVYVSRHLHEVTWVVRTLGNDHDCPRAEKIRVATPGWLNEVIGDELRLIPHSTLSEMKALILKRLGIEVSHWQMYRLRQMVLQIVDVAKQYSLVHRYGEEILRTNPGSTVKIKPRSYANKQVFERIYLCLGAMKDGFLSGCRKVLMFDGCHIKNVYGGCLLTAVGLDPNNGMYPIAYAVVEKERYESWFWFMELLVGDLGISKDDSNLWIVMSDKQKGLIRVVEEWLPYCEHRFCVYHLYANFKLLHKGLSLKLLLWRAAKATRPADFERIMVELRELDEVAYAWLSAREPQHWSKAYFRTTNPSDVILNNISECQNKLLLNARSMFVIDMLEAIRLQNMKRIGLRRQEMLKYNRKVCPRIEGILIKNRDLSNKLNAVWNGHNEFQVYGYYGDQIWAVNIPARTCTCRRWQLCGIPCAHAIASLLRMGFKAQDDVHECYFASTYLEVYNHFIHPIGPQDEWPQTPATFELQPPLVQTMPGRPKKHARKLQDVSTSNQGTQVDHEIPIVRDINKSKAPLVHELKEKLDEEVLIRRLQANASKPVAITPAVSTAPSVRSRREIPRVDYAKLAKLPCKRKDGNRCFVPGEEEPILKS